MSKLEQASSILKEMYIVKALEDAAIGSLDRRLLEALYEVGHSSGITQGREDQAKVESLKRFLALDKIAKGKGGVR